MMVQRILTLGCLAWAICAQLDCRRGLSQESSVTETAVQTKTQADAPKDAQAQDSAKPEELEFVRLLEEEKDPVALQTAIVTYERPGVIDGPKVSLIGAVHVGEATYYSQLNQLFRSFDSLLYEMVMDPSDGVPDPTKRGVSPVSTIQVGMKDALDLTFQLDEIDYKAKNFVHADMTPREFFDTMEARKEGLMQMMLRSIGSGLALQSQGKSNDLDLLTAMVAEDRARALRRALAKQMEMMDGQMAGLTGEDGKSTLITERNAKAFEVLSSELEAGKKKVGVFYGAGHLKDMHKRLVEDYGMQPVETKWLSAWDLK